MSKSQQDEFVSRSSLNRVINARAGGVLLLWIGVALLAALGWGVGLIGVGAILLVEQISRWRLAIDFDWFWVAAGVAAVGAGFAMTGGLQGALVPFLLIVSGGGLVASTLSRGNAS